MRLRIIVSTAFALLVLSTAAVNAQTLTDAYNAFSAHDIPKTLDLFKAVYANAENNAEDRVRAARGAAVIHWRYYQRHAEGREILKDAMAIGVESSMIQVALSRLEKDAGSYAESLEAASQACLLADSPQSGTHAKKAFAEAIVLPHADAATGMISAIPEAVRDAALPLAHQILHTMVTSEPGDLHSSRLLLTSSILLGNGPSALAGWRSYFRIADGVSAGTILDEAGARLSEHLPDWNRENADIKQNIAIARALSASRMYSPASLFIALYIPEGQRPEDIIDILNYGLLVHRMADLTDEYYRMTAIGEGDYPAYFAPLLTMIKETWESSSWTDEPFPIQPPFTPESVSSQSEKIDIVRQRLLEHFGAYIALGKTAGYEDLHYGHTVVDDKRTIEQYGRRAEVRFLLLDSIVSNGFQSWAWDYRSQHGGWANEIGIFQVRPAYTNGPMSIWRTLNDPKQLEERSARIERTRKQDIQRAKTNDIVYLPSVRNQMYYSAQQQLLDRLKAKGLSRSELQSHFVAELTRIQQEYSIFAHEGRHVIDELEDVTSSEELEFRAKLSEIAFAEMPKMALSGAIFSSNIGASTPHGQANKRVLRGIVDWMRENAGRVEGLDKNAPMLLQLNLLSDKLLREAVRSIDPLAKAHTK